MIPVLSSPGDLARESAIVHEQGPDALVEIESELGHLVTAASGAKAAADTANEKLVALAQQQEANRELRAVKRAQKQKDDDAGHDGRVFGPRDDFAKQAARSAAQTAEIQWLTDWDIRATNSKRPTLLLASQRADVAMCLSTAQCLFAQSLIAGVRRHAAVQESVLVDGQAQIPAEGGRANDLLKQAVVMMGRAGEISAAADVLESRIAMRETI
jgi:hypothetical protein